MELINSETWVGMDADVKGDIYEGLLQKNAEDVKSGTGQYFTPRPLIKAIVKVMQPTPGLTIYDIILQRLIQFNYPKKCCA